MGSYPATMVCIDGRELEIIRMCMFSGSCMALQN
jgi:hypothetical protein